MEKNINLEEFKNTLSTISWVDLINDYDTEVREKVNLTKLNLLVADLTGENAQDMRKKALCIYNEDGKLSMKFWLWNGYFREHIFALIDGKYAKYEMTNFRILGLIKTIIELLDKTSFNTWDLQDI